MTAVKHHYGGMLEGPAATGKSESVKELARALGKLCVVFNCSESLDGDSVSTFLKGVVSSAAWACLDEFNRMNMDTVNSAANQITSVQRALAKGDNFPRPSGCTNKVN